jgi:hypothetical protein
MAKSIKESVVKKSIAIIEKRLNKLNDIMNANPASDIINIRKEAQKLLDDNKGFEKRTTKEFISKIENLSKREKEAWKMVERQKNWEKDSDDMARLSAELSELKSELWYMNRKSAL